ncbi:alpha/beta hydrolase [Rhodococcus sp. D2-41]|uniref:Alpha/beta hydrolase n=1 Tax=Speluncibacter jeojiensis TaxID=2710754 RepID=A0A9X4RFU0_9ACTN|nr:alpha/beta hydrolase [Rhodococcus sp. D2-41]MDG3011858.1 alpha/beta hydrolase [Rhodococcus sp. D2-41]MDG3013311.1 alpha/beta hydrolase [Corynebacteriales bacterium D3-21]
MSRTPAYYRDQPDWRELQQFLPARLRLSDATAPVEQFWDWRGHRVHLDRYPAPCARAKVVLHHGVGTNGRQMSLILGAPLAARGFETVAPDNLGYGLTQVRPGATPSYDDWVDLVVDLLAHERARDDRPIVLFGLSAGGMLAYHVAAKAPRGTLAGIVGMAFLDQRSRRVRDETAHSRLTARVGGPLMVGLAKTPAATLRYPMRLASRMSALANDPGAQSVLMKDRTSAGNWVSVRFLGRYLSHAPAVEPEDFDRCPILLTQPAADRWTPLHLSAPFLSRITMSPVEIVPLDNAGHYPLEEPGLTQLQDAVADFVDAHSASKLA